MESITKKRSKSYFRALEMDEAWMSKKSAPYGTIGKSNVLVQHVLVMCNALLLILVDR
jgi:hypothetical protein